MALQYENINIDSDHESKTITADTRFENSAGSLELSAKIQGKDISLKDAAGMAVNLANEGFTFGNVTAIAGAAATFVPAIGPVLGPAISMLGSLFGGGSGPNPFEQLADMMNAQFAAVNANIERTRRELKLAIEETQDLVSETGKQVTAEVIDTLSQEMNRIAEEEAAFAAEAAARAGEWARERIAEIESSVLDYEAQTIAMVNAIAEQTANEVQSIIDQAYSLSGEEFDKFRDAALLGLGTALVGVLVAAAEDEEKTFNANSIAAPANSVALPSKNDNSMSFLLWPILAGAAYTAYKYSKKR
ncbi:MAG: hypothetical protein KDK41_15305 [Leptospiraceae bacterium]|nr:hypothetical protein [Leptospiraceae bacterium]